jgi:2-iminobutanoate/2-iminopropanoate deaminase
MISYPSAPGTPRSHLPFSPAVRVGDLLFISGQASVDTAGAIIDDTFEGEMRRSIANLARILEDSGSGLGYVVQTRNYVRYPEDLQAYNQLYREFFCEPFPARTTITNCLSGTLKYEIECIAVVSAATDSGIDAKV